MIGIYPQTDGSVFVDGAVAVRDLNNAIAWTLPVENAKTIAGLSFARRLPSPNKDKHLFFMAIASKSHANQTIGLQP